MEEPISFNNVGKPWSKTEDAQLNKLYNEDMLNVIEISKIHNRAPGGIISRLNKQGYIEHSTLARGYIEYITSDLYKELIQTNNRGKNKTKILDKPDVIITQLDCSLIKISKLDYIELKNDVKDMKNEIVHLKGAIGELVEMMKAVYEFEDT